MQFWWEIPNFIARRRLRIENVYTLNLLGRVNGVRLLFTMDVFQNYGFARIKGERGVLELQAIDMTSPESVGGKTLHEYAGSGSGVLELQWRRFP